MPSHPDLGAERRARLAAARLYLICDSCPGGRPLTDVLSAAIAGGVDMVQLRDKSLDDDELAAVADTAGALCRRLGALFVVNDRPAVARAVHADGVHIGQQDVPVARARELVGTDALVGLSTHAPQEIERASTAYLATGERAAGDNPARVDYIGVGPVFSTPTKPGRPATGLDLVHCATRSATLPFFAIGGIHAGNAEAVIAAGAQRVAVVRAIAEAPDPQRAARELRNALDRTRARSCFPIPAA